MRHRYKIASVLVVLVLAGAVVWWVRCHRKVSKPVHVELMDSVNYHMNEAQKHADIAKTFVNETEKYAEVYRNPRIDSAERARIGAEIYTNAVRKADSLRKRPP